jgi:hypothetical protein
MKKGLKKEWKIFWTIAGIFLIIMIILVISSFYLVSKKDNQEINYNFNNSSQNNKGYLHYSHTNITFSFNNEETCGNIEPIRVRRAFVEIQNQTNNLLNFREINETADIIINCSKFVPLGEEPGYIISGYGGYNSNGNIITQGYIYFYNCMKYSYAPGCSNYPDVEIHEILHSFGITHSNNTKSIMYPIASHCIYEIDNETLNKLKEIYS